jgi:hypothetical protein
MHAAWEEEATEHGFGPERVAAMQQEAAELAAAGVEKRGKHGETGDQLRSEILADLCREHALVPTRELVKLVMQRSMGLMHPYHAMGVVAEMFGDSDLLATTDGRVTTLEVLAAEQRATAAASRLLEASPSPPAERSELECETRRAEEEGRPFDELQRRAVELATGGARLVSITDPAGTGKGHASRAMTAIWRAAGNLHVHYASRGGEGHSASALVRNREAATARERIGSGPWT